MIYLAITRTRRGFMCILFFFSSIESFFFLAMFLSSFFLFYSNNKLNEVYFPIATSTHLNIFTFIFLFRGRFSHLVTLPISVPPSRAFSNFPICPPLLHTPPFITYSSRQLPVYRSNIYPAVASSIFPLLTAHRTCNFINVTL